MFTPLVLLVMGCSPDTPLVDSTPPEDSSPVEETDQPRETDQPELLPAVLVNELMADNESAVQADDGSFPDWLELYNADSETVDLTGYSLSDDWTEKDQAPFPEGTTLESGAYLLLWADDSDEPGHVPFKLSAQGEGVGIFSPEGTSVDWITFPPLVEDHAYARIPNGGEGWEQVARGTPGAANARIELQVTTLVEKGATWRYLDTGGAPDDTWTLADFDDSAWASGPAPLGYGDSQTTQVSYGDDASNKHITTWFRHAFEVPAETSTEATEASLALRVDDGAVVWLNGAELLRQGMSEGEIEPDTYATDATSGDGETTYTTHTIAPNLLLDGSNQLAVEVHQANSTSSDITLDLELDIEAWVEVE